MMASLASLAPTSPPLTGASTLRIPYSLARAAIFSANYGEDVV